MVAILAGVLAFAGCRTASLEDVAPTSLVPENRTDAQAETVTDDPRAASATSSQPVKEQSAARNTGQYPNLNVVPAGETAQISEEERAAKIAELEAAKEEAQSAAGKTGDEAEKLRRLARKHAQEALDEIEAE